MKINNLAISGVGGIRELELDFNPSFNVICGPNGIGKTTILKTLVHSFSSHSSFLKKNVAYDVGNFRIQFTDPQGKIMRRNSRLNAFEPQVNDRFSNASDLTKYIMYFQEERVINYQKLDSIPRDENVDTYRLGIFMEKGIQIENMKGWLVNRYLFSHLPGSLTEAKLANLRLAMKSFSILDPAVQFRTVNDRALDIMISNKDDIICFEYLSAGYKTCIYLILGLIKEIEYRFGALSGKAEDFEGIVLIDEIDLHLHPLWQAKLVNALKVIFSKAQFIVTTHSPSVLQILKKEEIIPLTACKDGSICVKQLNLTEYGLQGWTIEEILRDVMEMPETTSALYEDTKKKFEKAMQTENVEEVKKQYLILEKMLHPDSIIRKLIKIQMAGLEESQ